MANRKGGTAYGVVVDSSAVYDIAIAVREQTAHTSIHMYGLGNIHV